MKEKPLEKSEVTTSTLSAYLVQLLKTYSILHWRMPIDGVRTGGRGRARSPLRGFPDYAGTTRKGRFWAAEIKGPKDRMSEKQTDWMADLERSNALVQVVRTYDDCVDLVGRLLNN